jgi:hypothetical protein
MVSDDDIIPGAPGHMVAVLGGVHEHGEGKPVELWRTLSGRLVIRAYNMGGNGSTYVDLWDLLDWLQAGPGAGLLEDHARTEPT